MLRIFDTHAHYDDESFLEDRDSLFEEFQKQGIDKVVNIAASQDSIQAIYELTQKYPMVYGSLGIHPSDVKHITQTQEEIFHQIREYQKSEKIVAIGEIGLDYYWDKEPEVKALQQRWFIDQLNLAKDLDLPVIIHSREAAKDTFDILMAYGPEKKGVIHCYSGSAEMAKDYVKYGYYIGVGGVVTFKNAKSIKETVEAVDLSQIVIETDAPYLAPVPFRGKRNSSLYLPYVIEEIGKIKGMSPEIVAEVTYENALRLFGLV